MPTLDWLGRDAHLRAAEKVPYRLLQDVGDLGVMHVGSAGDVSADNLLVQGDNLEALKALLPFYAGQVKCIYIDPPYNTRSAFEHYDDSLEHAQWLGMIVPRLMLLREFLSEDGSIFIQLDRNESHHAKVVMDEIFDRKNFVAHIAVKTRSPSAFSTVNPGVFKAGEQIFWYSANRDKLDQKRSWTERSPDLAYDRYIPNIDEGCENWVIEPINKHIILDCEKFSIKSQIAKLNRFYSTKSRHIVRTASISDTGAGSDTIQAKKYSLERPNEIIRQERDGYEDIYLIGGEQILFYGKNIQTQGRRMFPAQMLTDVWTDLSWEGIASEGQVRFPKGKKPERLLMRILDLVTNPGDLVLDSFLGSGTTAAVAHKMGRRWIGVEMGEHARTHCATRLRKVIDGEQGGISKDVGWQGGGGFRFCTLGPAVFDADGRVAPGIRFADLARHIWFSETRRPLNADPTGPVLGQHGDRTVALLFNGILKDRSATGGNVLTHATLRLLRDDAGQGGPMTVYAAACRLSDTTLRDRGITFRQTPYDLPQRA